MLKGRRRQERNTARRIYSVDLGGQRPQDRQKHSLHSIHKTSMDPYLICEIIRFTTITIRSDSVCACVQYLTFIPSFQRAPNPSSSWQYWIKHPVMTFRFCCTQRWHLVGEKLLGHYARKRRPAGSIKLLSSVCEEAGGNTLDFLRCSFQNVKFQIHGESPRNNKFCRRLTLNKNDFNTAIGYHTVILLVCPDYIKMSVQKYFNDAPERTLTQSESLDKQCPCPRRRCSAR